mgnify:CR=1 FL=1
MGEALPNGGELEAAMLCVDGRRFISRLDWARKDLDQRSNAWVFLTALAEKNPVKFMEYVDEFSNELFEWEKIDKILLGQSPTTGKKKIEAIKLYRQYRDVDLKEAKEMIEKRMQELSIR